MKPKKTSTVYAKTGSNIILLLQLEQKFKTKQKHTKPMSISR